MEQTLRWVNCPRLSLPGTETPEVRSHGRLEGGPCEELAGW